MFDQIQKVLAIVFVVAGGAIGYFIGHRFGYDAGVETGSKIQRAAQLEYDNEIANRVRSVRESILRCELELGGVWDESEKRCADRK